MWLPERITLLAPNSRTKASLTSWGWISQYTCSSRTRRAMSCVYWAPKSRISILQCMGEASSRARDALEREVASCHDERDGLEDRADEEGRAHPPVGRRQMADLSQQRRPDSGRDDEHDALDRVERSHGDALLARPDRVGDDSLQSGPGSEGDEIADDDRVHHPALRREAVRQVGDGA